jgi:hypothetical protein
MTRSTRARSSSSARAPKRRWNTVVGTLGGRRLVNKHGACPRNGSAIAAVNYCAACVKPCGEVLDHH